MLKKIDNNERPTFVLIRDGKPDFIFRPECTYTHKRGGTYRIIGISNTSSEDPDYPATVIYENIDTKELWSKKPERFADGMTPKP